MRNMQEIRENKTVQSITKIGPWVLLLALLGWYTYKSKSVNKGFVEEFYMRTSMRATNCGQIVQ